MNRDKIINLYEEYERKGANFAGYEKVCTDHVVRFIYPDKYGSFITYFNSKGCDPSKIIRDEIQYFQCLEKNFEWKIYSTDTTENIGELLVQHGFSQGEVESFLVLDLDQFRDTISEWVCTRVTTQQGVDDTVSVSENVWNENLSHQRQYLLNQLKLNPKFISIYCVYHEGQAVASARIEFSESSPFAGIWGGATLKEYRKKGLYQALLNVRAKEAIERGYKYLTIDASDMSRPIAEKHGFQFISKTIPYEYSTANKKMQNDRLSGV